MTRRLAGQVIATVSGTTTAKKCQWLRKSRRMAAGSQKQSLRRLAQSSVAPDMFQDGFARCRLDNQKCPPQQGKFTAAHG